MLGVSSAIARRFVSPVYPEIVFSSKYVMTQLSRAEAALRGGVKSDAAILGRLMSAQDRRTSDSLQVQETCKSLYHPLSAKMVEIFGVAQISASRTPIEEEVASQYQGEILTASQLGFCEFINLLECIASDSREEPTSVRVGVNVRTQTDVFGVYWRYLDWTSVIPELERLHSFMKGAAFRECPLYGAAVVLAALLCIHPFRDGNGRTSRIFFNGLIRSYNPKLAYIPLKEYWGVSGYAFELSMRQAIIFGRWGVLANYIASVINFMRVPSIDGEK